MPEFKTQHDVRIHYEDEGQGPLVVLLHGWCGDRTVWQRVLPSLTANRRVVRPDMRGCGRSSGLEGTYDMDHLANDVQELLEHLDADQATLVGWSMGTGVIHRVLQLHGTDRLAGVVLIDYPIKLKEKRDVAEKVCHQLNKRRAEFIEAFVERMLLKPTDEDKAMLSRPMKFVTRETACQLYRAMGEAPDPIDEVFDIPALLAFPLQGWFPESLADWRERFPSHETVELPMSRHAPPLEEPETFTRALLDFTQNMGELVADTG